MKAFILAGGYGKRLRPLTDTTPKPMILVGGKPIVLWQIEWLQRHGVDEFVLCIGHLKEKVMDFFGDGSRLGIRVDYAIETEPLGTGGALKNASRYFPSEDPFFAFNGDIITDIDLTGVRQACAPPDVLGALALVPLPSPYGIVQTDPQGYIGAFIEKPRLEDRWINAGIYCLKPSINAYLPDRGSLELDVFPKLAQERRLTASQHGRSFWLPIDSPKDMEEATKALQPA